MDVMKYLLSQPLLRGRLSKWSMHLLQFELTYVSQRAVTGQALADFLAAHPCVDELSEDKDHGLPWKLFFDGSFTKMEVMLGAPGCIFYHPQGNPFSMRAR